MTQKQLTRLVAAAFLLCVGIVAAFAVSDLARSKVSNPIEKSLTQPKK